MRRLKLQRWASFLVRKYPWTAASATLVAAIGLIFAIVKDGHILWLLGTAVALWLSSYAWGYSTRALKYIQWPSLAHLHREQYAEVWDALAATPNWPRLPFVDMLMRPLYAGPRRAR